MMCHLNRRRFLQADCSHGLAASQGIVSVWAAEPLKIGFVYVGPIGDYGWTHGHDLGRKAVEAHFGDRVKTTYVESVAEGPDAERVMRQLVQQGHGLIFTTSFGYMEQTLRVAKQFPKLKFEHATGYKTAANMSAYNARFYEGRAVVGDIAGTLTRTGKIGYVASMPIPEVVMGINATALAARKVRPDASVRVVWVHTWFDPAKEADAARALIDQGVDIMTQHTDSPAPLQVAESRGILGFGVASDMKTYAPRAQLSFYSRSMGRLLYQPRPCRARWYLEEPVDLVRLQGEDAGDGALWRGRAGGTAPGGRRDHCWYDQRLVSRFHRADQKPEGRGRGAGRRASVR